MEASPHFTTSSDLEIRAAKIADPNIGMLNLVSAVISDSSSLPDLKTKHVVAAEIREMLDTVRDAESSRALPYLVPAILDIICSGKVAQHKESAEYQFRRVLLEIINRLPISETVRPYFNDIFNCMLHILRHDNEENGTLACKTLLDLVRGYRHLAEECLNEFVAIFQEGLRNMQDFVLRALSADSAVLDLGTVPLSLQSCKVVGEMSMVMVIMSQVNRPTVLTPMQSTIGPAFEALALESPAQKKARDDYEAMGGIWAGIAPTITNVASYGDFIHAQIKVPVKRYSHSHVFTLSRSSHIWPTLCDTAGTQTKRMVNA